MGKWGRVENKRENETEKPGEKESEREMEVKKKDKRSGIERKMLKRRKGVKER